MDIDRILKVLGELSVDYILIGGVNFLLRHSPELTFDVDVWVRDDDANLAKLNQALRELQGEWGPTAEKWDPVPIDWKWLRRQACFCLTTAAGALDIFREVKGLEGAYDACRERAFIGKTGTGIAYVGLSDADMLRCQQALSANEQKAKRMELLQAALRRQT